MRADDPGSPILDVRALAARIARDEPVLVLFYADWCGFCVRFLPPWRERAGTVPSEAVAADISDWDDPRWDEHGIEAVPTLIAFAGGREVARLASPLGLGLTEAQLDAFLGELRA